MQRGGAGGGHRTARARARGGAARRGGRACPRRTTGGGRQRGGAARGRRARSVEPLSTRASAHGSAHQRRRRRRHGADAAPSAPPTAGAAHPPPPPRRSPTHVAAPRTGCHAATAAARGAGSRRCRTNRRLPSPPRRPAGGASGSSRGRGGGADAHRHEIGPRFRLTPGHRDSLGRRRDASGSTGTPPRSQRTP